MMVSFTARAKSNVMAYRLLAYSQGDDIIEISHAAENTIPDYVAVKDVDKGDLTQVNMYPLAAWQVIAGSDIKVGDNLTTGTDGTAVPTDDPSVVFGYAVEEAQEGQLVTLVISRSKEISIEVDDIKDAGDTGKRLLKINTPSGARNIIIENEDAKALINGETTNTNKKNLQDLLFSDGNVKAFLQATTTDENKTALQQLLVSNADVLGLLSGNPTSDNKINLRTMIGAGVPYSLPAATTTTLGGVKKGATVTASTATDVATAVKDLNSLITVLKNAGIIS
ncbi:putative head fiber protein [Bacillus phage BSP2]|uniref:Tail knob protein n=1 Tax=Bacillus phage BSTP4 TaxID=2801529 RepID=A0A7T8IVF9_9CAUD|nr:putative head fiber protein [Bacillus phage BSP4]AYJ76488.1 putative head fiber protein [Bacillus phage BSP2]QQO90046.1 tail knob protein [Bacillus phage BSTP4]